MQNMKIYKIYKYKRIQISLLMRYGSEWSTSNVYNPYKGSFNSQHSLKTVALLFELVNVLTTEISLPYLLGMERNIHT